MGNHLYYGDNLGILRNNIADESVDLVYLDVDGARALAEQDKYQFQWWAVSLDQCGALRWQKKGADTGIDGFVYFKPDGKTTEKASCV